MIARIENHPSDPDAALVFTPPDIAHTMGRFALARYSRKATAYIVRADDLDKLRTFLRTQASCSLVDERDDTGVRHPSGPLPECRSCGSPASRKASLTLNRCQSCGDAWHPITYTDPPGVAVPRIECPACGVRQRAGFAFCGNCGAPTPPPPAAGARPILPTPDDRDSRTPLQDPLPVATAIPEHLAAGIAVHTEEEPDREWYP